MIIAILVVSDGSGYLVRLRVHYLLLVLANLALALRVSLPLIASLANLVVSAVAALIHLLHLILILLQRSLIIINYNLLLGTSVTVGCR